MHNYGIKEMNSGTIIIKEFLHHFNYNFFFSQFKHIMHFVHTIYCRKYGSSQSIFIRYPKAFFFLKIFLIRPNES